MIRSVNPATGELVREFPPFPPDIQEQCVRQAASAFAAWRMQPLASRTPLLLRAAEILRAENEQHARLLTEEMGKPVRAAREEVAKCERTLRFYAAHASEFMEPREVAGDGIVTFDPLGPVLAIMPWNFPYWQVIRFAAPAITAGNVVLLKHASNVPRSALELERLFTRAGAPPGVFQTLLMEVEDVAALIADDRIAAVTLTGSEGAGRAVARTAGEHLKKCVLELGGSDPFIVLADADVAAAARTGAVSRMINNGQSCIAAKRFIVEAPVAAEFTTRFLEAVRGMRVGDPMEETTDIGPLALPQIRDEVARQVEDTVAAGARVLLGGKTVEGPGSFYEPTVLADVRLDSPAAVEEVFGPVAPIFVVRDAEEALAVANATRFGLGANVWTQSDLLATRFSRDLEAGTVFINGMVASDPRFPFGGIKKSGYGRELSGEGLREFVNVKTVRRGDTTRPRASQAE